MLNIKPKSQHCLDPKLQNKRSSPFRLHPGDLKVTYIGVSESEVSSIQSDSPARPLLGSLTSYFEVSINQLSHHSSSLCVGLSEEDFLLSQRPGFSRRSFGITNEGTVYQNSSPLRQTGVSFISGDTLGCGVNYDRQETFFTKNGEIIGTVPYPGEIRCMYPTIALAYKNDTITAHLIPPFQFDLKQYLDHETNCEREECLQESLEGLDMHELVFDYLKTNGYFETAVRMIEKRPKFERSKSRRLSERCSFEECANCREFVCDKCLADIMENIEASAGLSIRKNSFNTRDSIDSVDLESLYLRHTESDIKIENEEPPDLGSAAVRAEIRKMIDAGRVQDTFVFLEKNFPAVLENCKVSLHVQQFLEFVKERYVEQALEYARNQLGPFRNHKVLCRNNNDCELFVWEIIGVLCYERPENSPLGFLVAHEQRNALADVVNSSILAFEGTSPKSKLTKLLQQLLLTQKEYKQLFYHIPVDVSFNS